MYLTLMHSRVKEDWPSPISFLFAFSNSTNSSSNWTTDSVLVYHLSFWLLETWYLALYKSCGPLGSSSIHHWQSYKSCQAFSQVDILNFSLTPTCSKIMFYRVISFYCYHEVLNALFHVPLYQKGIESVHKVLLLHENLNVIVNKINKEFTIHSSRIRSSSTVPT